MDGGSEGRVSIQKVSRLFQIKCGTEDPPERERNEQKESCNFRKEATGIVAKEIIQG